MVRFGWVGFHREGVAAFQSLLEAGAPVQAAFTLPPDAAASRSGAIDYAPLCQRFHVPRYEVVSINDPVPRGLLRALALDIVFVIGWGEVPDHETLRTARIGMIGARPSPAARDRAAASSRRGRIPGEYAIAHCLVWLATVPGPKLIDQTEVMITPYDTCESLSERAAAANRDMVRRALPKLLAGQRPVIASTLNPAESPQPDADGAPRGRGQSRARPGTPVPGRGPHRRAATSL